jgi:hypothetical protein
VICPYHGELGPSDYPLVDPEDQPRCPHFGCDLVLAPLSLPAAPPLFDWGPSLEPVARSSRRRNRIEFGFFAWPKSDPNRYPEPSDNVRRLTPRPILPSAG